MSSVGEGLGIALGVAVGVGAMALMGPIGGVTVGMNMTTLVMGMTGAMAMSQIQAGVNAAEMREYNAQMAERSATIVQQQGDAKAKLIRRQRRHLIGRQATQYAMAGVDAPGDEIFDETDILVKEDLIALQMQVDIEKFGFWGDATRQRLLGKQALQQGIMSAGQTILTTGMELEMTKAGKLTDFNAPKKGIGTKWQQINRPYQNPFTGMQTGKIY